ncbi:energy-coupling factor transporter transmembrane protein EcfT, partial [Streptococcus sp. SPC0]|nr:energy-coupling factor transporter transmembrane protein EcfT [Streptococcus sp. SPC0]
SKQSLEKRDIVLIILALSSLFVSLYLIHLNHGRFYNPWQ